MQIIIFTLKNKYYGIDTEYVLEINEKMEATKVPKTPKCIEGLINLRGDIITLINISNILNLNEDVEYNSAIIVKNNVDKFGIMVENIIEVVEIEEESFLSLENPENGSIVGIIKNKGEIINIIDVNILINRENL